MSTRAENQQKKQRQKEFKEKKEHLEKLKIAAGKAKRDSSGKKEEGDGVSKNSD